MTRHLCFAAAALLAGCGFIPAETPPLIEAHRAAAGNWPENSRTAVTQSVARNYPGIEFDLVLTKDLVPVLAHDTWLHHELCTQADGSEIPADQQVFIQDLTLAELHAGYRCGGKADPEQPDAQVVADTHLTLDELLGIVASDEDMTLHFDIKWHPTQTPPATDFVREIFGRVRARNLQNPWYASSNEEAFIRVAADDEVPTSLTWPKFPEGSDSTLTALSNELLAQFGLGDPLAIAKRSGATGLLLQYRVTDRRLVEAAKAEGMAVQLWTLNSESVLEAYCSFPADALITDFPERAPCL